MGFGALANNSSLGDSNTAVGANALLNDITGGNNTAIGAAALGNNDNGSDNTAVGTGALTSTTFGVENTAMGVGAMQNNTIGSANTAIGEGALSQSTSSTNNTAIGAFALTSLLSGDFNIALGIDAGDSLNSGSGNIYIGNAGNAFESFTIRIGTPGTETAFFAGGVSGVTTGVADAVPVLIDSQGQLGTISSSRRFKQDIQDMGDVSRGVLRLRPVTFRYKKPFTNGSKPIQYGLIAEEVAEVYPDLVAHSADGQIETVKYQVLDVLLLNEVQRQQAEIKALEARLAALEQTLQRLTARRAPLQQTTPRGGR